MNNTFGSYIVSPGWRHGYSLAWEEERITAEGINETVGRRKDFDDRVSLLTFLDSLLVSAAECPADESRTPEPHSQAETCSATPA